MPETTQDKAVAAVLETLRELGGGLTGEDDVVFEGKRIILPATMRERPTDAADFIYAWDSEQREMATFTKTYKFRPWDGAVATFNALKNAFGVVRMPNSLFTQATFIDIPVGVNETVRCPWGEFQVPGFQRGHIYTGKAPSKEDGILFQLTIECPKKDGGIAEGIFRVVEEELRQRSIYRGKCFDGEEMPNFIDLSGVDAKKVIYNHDTMEELDENVWQFIEHPDELEALGVGTKRSTAMYGEYGTGKTLGGYLTAQKAVANGVTFVYCRPGRDNFEECMQTAKLYQPSVVFFEDIDIIGNVDSESQTMSRILDIFDGIQSKGLRMQLMFTTNKVEQLHKGLTRPGRIDGMIHIGKLDSDGVRRMAYAVAPEGKIADDVDWVSVGQAADGFLPAFVREMVDRAMVKNMVRGVKEGSGVTMLTTDDFLKAAKSLRPQLELMEAASDAPKVDSLENAFKRISQHSVEGVAVRRDGHDDIFARLELPEEVTER